MSKTPVYENHTYLFITLAISDRVIIYFREKIFTSSSPVTSLSFPINSALPSSRVTSLGNKVKVTDVILREKK